MKREYETLYEEKWPFANISIYHIKQYLEGKMKLEKLSETDRWQIYYRHTSRSDGLTLNSTYYSPCTFEDYLEDILKILKERIITEELSYFLENLD